MRFALATLLLLAPLASAHGFGGLAAGDTLASATPVGIPAYLFDEAPPGTSVHYYRLEAKGDVRIRLVAPAGGEPTDAPILFLFGPTFTSNATAPADVERPDAGGIVLAPTDVRVEVVPELGARWSVLLEREIELAPGTHILALRTHEAGPVGVVVTGERSGWVDRFALPSLRDDARAWAGVLPWPAIAAGVLGGTLVAALAWRGRRRPWSLHALGAHVAAALFAGTGLALATDAAGTAAGWGYVAVALACAAGALASTRPVAARPSTWQRALLAAVALVGWWGYAGAVWGPVSALIAAVLPEPSEK